MLKKQTQVPRKSSPSESKIHESIQIEPVGFKSGVKGRVSDRSWERRCGLWWEGDVCKMRGKYRTQ